MADFFPIIQRKVGQKRRFSLLGNQFGMSVTELMVAICIVAILAAVAIPFYINYVQQSRVVALIIPRLHLIETNVSLFYSMKHRLPTSSDIAEILKDVDTDYCDISLSNGSVIMTITAADRSAKLHILNGKILVASPVIAKAKIVSWHLDGELAERLKISY